MGRRGTERVKPLRAWNGPVIFSVEAVEKSTSQNTIKNTWGYISPYCQKAPVQQNFITFGIRGKVADIITNVKFLVNQFRGLWVLTRPQLPFPIELLRRPYNGVRTAVRHWFFSVLIERFCIYKKCYRIAHCMSTNTRIHRTVTSRQTGNIRRYTRSQLLLRALYLPPGNSMQLTEGYGMAWYTRV